MLPPGAVVPVAAAAAEAAASSEPPGLAGRRRRTFRRRKPKTASPMTMTAMGTSFEESGLDEVDLRDAEVLRAADFNGAFLLPDLLLLVRVVMERGVRAGGGVGGGC